MTSYRTGAPAPKRSSLPLPLAAGKQPSRRPFPLTVLARPGSQTPAAALPELHASVTTERLALNLPIPPSINHQYATANGRRILSSAGRNYKATVAHQVLVTLGRSPHRESLLRTLRGSDLTLSIHFYFASPLRRDVDGGLKIAQDAICEALGLNDNRIVEIHLYKSRDASQPRIEMALSTRPHSI